MLSDYASKAKVFISDSVKKKLSFDAHIKGIIHDPKE